LFVTRWSLRVRVWRFASRRDGVGRMLSAMTYGILFLPQIWAIVLHWRTPELTTRCVRALTGEVADIAAEGFDMRILVVDNGSGEALDRTYPRAANVEQLRLSRNFGYAGGNNAGLRHAFKSDPRYVVLVNSDVVVGAGSFRRLLRAAEADRSTGVVGPLVVQEASPNVVESSGHRFNRFTGRHTEIDHGAQANRCTSRQPIDVDGVSGCTLLVSVSAARATGLLDERFHLYFEDLDWCLRIREAGFRVVSVPSAVVRHLGGGSIGRAAPARTYFSVRNHLWVASRHGRWRGSRLQWPLICAYHIMYVLSHAEFRHRGHLSALLHGARDAWHGPIPSVPAQQASVV
jgi:GT2 family glycosyltransferase